MNRSQPDTVMVPHAEPHLVYDVRYHVRDSRRSLEPVLHGNQYTTTEVTAANVLDGIAEMGGSAFVPGARHGMQNPGVEGSGYGKVSMLDNTNGGYT